MAAMNGASSMLALSCASLLFVAGAVSLHGAAKVSEFGKTNDGAAIQIYTLTNSQGMEVRIMNYGGAVVSLKTPDRKGTMADVVLGFDDLKGYLAKRTFFGVLVGRYANRIAKGRFTLNGVEYKLATNNGENSLHGGVRGFDSVVWTPRQLPDGGLELTYLSKDGEENYPGNLKVTVTYHLTESNELRITYAATTDKDTVVNLTNHSFFNLKGAGSGDILGHEVMIAADRFTPVDAGLIPTGELRAVAGTPFDFRKPTAIGARIGQDYEQLKIGRGYDHNFVLNGKGGAVRLAARVVEPTSGRVLEVLTDQPGIQLYTGNFLDGTVTGKGGKVYSYRYAFCLETQHFPDSPNKPSFPTTVLKPGKKFQSTTVYKFATAK